MTLRKSILPLISFGAVLLIALGAQATLAAPNQDSAKGRVNYFGQMWDFNANSTATGFNADGTVKITTTNTDPNQTFWGEVTCLRVVGATATTPATAVVAGVITKAPPGSFASSFVINASDSGKFASAPDGFTGFLSSAPPPPDGNCPAPSTFVSPVTDGEVIIHNTLP